MIFALLARLPNSNWQKTCHPLDSTQAIDITFFCTVPVVSAPAPSRLKIEHLPAECSLVVRRTMLQ
jgi:hypothetical protein